MSGRIALMVRGLPSIGIDEAVERFGKYYPKGRTDQFHNSESFRGSSYDNSIAFVNAATGGHSGGQGLNKQNISDLRKLKEDFNNYTQANPGIYTNMPTTNSRAKLYKRVGFQQASVLELQAMDTRRIADKDLPYVKAIDAAVLPYDVRSIISPNTTPAFIKSGDNVMAASRLYDNSLLSILRGQDTEELLSKSVDFGLNFRKKRGNKSIGSPEDEPQRARAITPQESLAMQQAVSQNRARLDAEARMAARRTGQQQLERQQAINAENLIRQEAINEGIRNANRARYSNASSPSRPSIIDDYDDIPF